MPDEIPRGVAARLVHFGLVPQPVVAAPKAAQSPVAVNGGGGGDRDRAYALAALSGEGAAVASAPCGDRQRTLRDAAIKLIGFVNTGALTEAEYRDTLLNAGRSASTAAEPFTDTEINATLNRTLGRKEITRQPPDDGQVVEMSLVERNGHFVAVEEGDGEEKDIHGLAVARKAYEFRLTDEARLLWQAQRAALMGQQPPPVVNLIDMLAIPDEPARYRVEDLWPVGGRVLLAAQYKAGKSSLVANLMRSLADGDLFLGRWQPNQVTNITLIDTELDERMLRRWLRDQQIDKAGNVNVISMRGRLSTFNILEDTTRARWAEQIAGSDVVLLDCLRPCLDAIGLSEDKDAGRFLTAFDSLCNEGGVAEALVVHHMGHSMERSRGDSRLLDWPDVLWKIVRDSDEDGNDIESGDRFFSAMGRDVHVAEAQLDWTPQTRSLMVCGGGRADKKARNTVVDIEEILSDPANVDGLSQNELVRKLKGFGNSRDGSRRAIQMALTDGLLVAVDGPRNTQVHILNPSRRK
jgi:hypothetical protein